MFAFLFSLSLFVSAVYCSSTEKTEAVGIQGRDGYGSYGGYSSYGSGGYGGSGGYYMAPYGSSGLGGIGELITGVIGALAGLALLAALTAAIVIPLAFFIGRKKRDLSDFSPLFQKKMKEMEILQEYIRSIPDVENQPYKLMSNYLSCTGLLNKKNRCLERISCEGGHPNGNFTSVEAGAISIIVDTILENKFVDADFRQRLHKAVSVGKNKKDCDIYECTDYFKKAT